MHNKSLGYLFLLSTLAISAAIQAEEFYIDSSEQRAAIRLHAGIVMGESNEFVYDAFGSGSGTPGYKVSQLNWMIDGATVAGVGTSFSPTSWLRLNGDYWHNVQDGEGTMDDYDWLYIGLDWSDHSHHENTAVTDITQWDANAEWKLVDFDNDQTRLFALTGYRRDRFAWMSRGGTATYSWFGYRDTYFVFYDIPVISYEQTFSAPYIGLGVHTSNTSDSFSDLTVTLNATARYSNRARGEDVDNHYLRSLLFEEAGENGIWYAYDINLDFGLSEHTSLSIGASWQTYEEIKADTFVTDMATGTVSYYPGPSAGLSHSSTNFNARFSYLF